MENKYPQLLSPIQINSLMLKNRILGMPTGCSTAPAAGGAAVVTIGSVAVDCEKSSWDYTAEYSFSKYNAAWHREQISTAHYGGAAISCELFHAGVWCRVPKGDFAWGPSDCYMEEYDRQVRALDEEHMQEICGAYARTARDAKDMGYDMFLMHFGHGWLASSFLSPYFNKRTDEYGGSIENRARFPLRILKAVRDAVGPKFPIDMRLNDNDRLPGGIEFEDVIRFVQLAEPYIDAVQLSCGQDMIRLGNIFAIPTNLTPHMLNVEYAAALRKHLSSKLKVYAVGAIMNPDEAEEIIASGKVDMVALGRTLTADPQYANKLMEGRREDIIPCVRCQQCYHIATNRRNVGCTVNPAILRPGLDTSLVRTDSPKHVVVIGAGPAGLQAAITADKVGHKVTLVEKDGEVGGLIRLIAREHYKSEFRDYLDYMRRQLDKSHVDLRLNTPATPDYIRSLKPDRLIIAIGAEPVTPPVEGIDGPNVMGFRQAIMEPETIGDRVAVIGGGVVGIELALGLSLEEGKEVHVIEMGDQIAATANMLYQTGIKEAISRAKTLKIHLKTTLKKVNFDSVVAEPANASAATLSVDTVIVAAGLRPKTAEAHSFYGIVPDTLITGDCKALRIVMEANFEGYAAGNKK